MWTSLLLALAPPLSVRLLNIKKGNPHLIYAIAEDLFTAILFLSLIAPLPFFAKILLSTLYPFLFFCDLLTVKLLQSRFAFAHFRFIQWIDNFTDSFIELKIPWFLGGFLFFLSSYIAFFCHPFSYSIELLYNSLLLLPLVVLNKSHNIIIHLLINPLKRWSALDQRNLTLPQEALSENEKSIYPLPNYPLLKETFGFSGEKLFEIKLEASEKDHVILFIVESLRAKDLSAEITPHLKKLSKESIFFSNFYANSTQTFNALFSLLFGLPLYNESKLRSKHHKIITLPMEGMIDRFKAAGYKTAFLYNSAGNFHNQDSFLTYHKMDEVYDRSDIEKQFPEATGTHWGIDDEYLVAFASSWLKKQSGPTLTIILTISNHHPNKIPAHYERLHLPSFNHIKEECYRNLLKTTAYSDYCIDLFRKNLEDLDINPLLIIMGDHGRSMQEHGKEPFYQHLYDELTRVPLLIISKSSLENPMQIDDPASHIDILPTLMDILGLKGRHIGIGSSLIRKRLSPKAFFCNKDYDLRGLRNKRYKYIESSLGKELFDLTLDPEERNNLTLTLPDLAQQFAEQTERLFEFLSPFLERQRNLIPPLSDKKTELKRFNFSETGIKESELYTLLSQLPQIEDLNLSNCLFISSLQRALPASLRTLILDHLTINDDDLTNLPPSLTRLSLLGCSQITDRGLSILSCLPLLEELIMSSIHISNEAWHHFFMERGEKLTSLHLNYNKLLNDKALTPLSQYKCLKEIKLYDALNLTDETLKILKDHPLKSLEITSAHAITDQGIAQLTSSQLEKIILKDAYNLTDRSLEHLSTLPKLKHITLTNAIKLTAVGLRALSSKKLEQLHLLGSPLLESEQILGRVILPYDL